LKFVCATNKPLKAFGLTKFSVDFQGRIFCHFGSLMFHHQGERRVYGHQASSSGGGLLPLRSDRSKVV